MVSKPLVRQVVLVDDDVSPLAADGGGDKDKMKLQKIANN